MRAEEFTYASGETTTIYRAPFRVDGPLTYVNSADECVMAFMYAHFVFTWRQGTATVAVSHGHIGGDNLVLFRSVPINGPWHTDTLIAFGTTWVRQRLARFMGRPGGDPGRN